MCSNFAFVVNVKSLYEPTRLKSYSLCDYKENWVRFDFELLDVTVSKPFSFLSHFCRYADVFKGKKCQKESSKSNKKISMTVEEEKGLLKTLKCHPRHSGGNIFNSRQFRFGNLSFHNGRLY